MQLTIITGRSGSGKSSALHVLEDIGFYCVDNLPMGMIPILTKELRSQNNISKLAIGIDARNARTHLHQFDDVLNTLRVQGIKVTIIYLDADTKTLLRRFSETRRKHPLSSQSVSLAEALQTEKDVLADIGTHADMVIDTTSMNIHLLNEEIRRRTQQEVDSMAIQIQSFGFKHGVPTDSDFLFDVRCLPNPHWISHLRMQTGLDQDVQTFLDEEQNFNDMLSDISHFIKKWIPAFQNNNRRYMTIAIGCTGGQHRSVYLAEKLKDSVAKNFELVQLRHRDLPLKKRQ